MRFTIFMAAMLLTTSVMAADITPVRNSLKCNNTCLAWEGLSSADTTVEWSVSGGKYEFFVDGNVDGADFNLQYGKTTGSLKDIDTDQMPNGVHFSDTSTGNSAYVCLGRGYADISFTSALGVNASAAIYLDRIGDCN